MSITSTLPVYVEQNTDKLIRDAVIGSESAKMFTLQTGVKNKSAINLLNTTVVLQDGSACGWNGNGTSAVSQREITAPTLKVNMSFCDKTLENTALQYEVRVAAGQKTLPFEQDFVTGVLEQVGEQVESMIWNGDSSLGAVGLIEILADSSTGITTAAQDITHTAITTAALAKTAIDAVLIAIPAKVIKRAKIFLGYDVYRLYVMALQAANLYHTPADGLDVGEMYYPGSQIKIKAVGGLDGTDVIVAGDPANFFFGCDLTGDEEKFDLWYSKDNQEFRLAVQFNIGVQVAYPNAIVLSQKA